MRIVRLRDGASLMHVGYPDMRVPISFALNYPARAATQLPQLDFVAGLALEFEPPDLEAFPLLALAREAGEQRRDAIRAPSTRRTRLRFRRSWRDGFGSSTSTPQSRTCSRESTALPPATWTSWSRQTEMPAIS